MDLLIEHGGYVAGAVLILCGILYGKIAGLARQRRERLSATQQTNRPRRRIPLT
jgi:hypothetical protein